VHPPRQDELGSRTGRRALRGVTAWRSRAESRPAADDDPLPPVNGVVASAEPGRSDAPDDAAEWPRGCGTGAGSGCRALGHIGPCPRRRRRRSGRTRRTPTGTPRTGTPPSPSFAPRAGSARDAGGASARGRPGCSSSGPARPRPTAHRRRDRAGRAADGLGPQP
jgi:hypothetical protein